MTGTRPPVYSVSEVNGHIAGMFGTDPMLSAIYVQGEVSECTYARSRHIYFALKDENNQKLQCVMFSFERNNLKFQLEIGQKVIVYGKVTTYQERSQYQLQASHIRLSGSGELYARFLEMKNRLEEMGMFSEIYKKPIPRYIHRLGVVTAPTGAAVRDIINVSKRRNPGIQIILYPTLVQGEGAAEGVVRGIRVLDRAGVDTIIVGRGGGSIEDLWAFNEEIVARAIFDAETPVISAVGHETDFTIADFVSDKRAPTPSAAAELAVDDMVIARTRVLDLKGRLSVDMRQVTDNCRRMTEYYRARMKARSPENQIREKRLRLDQLMERMDHAMVMKIQSARTKAESFRGRLNIGSMILAAQKRRDLLRPRLETSMAGKVTAFRNRLAVNAARIEALSPQSHLEHGYAYVEKQDGKALRSISDAQCGEILTITLKDGKLSTEVCSIEGQGEN